MMNRLILVIAAAAVLSGCGPTTFLVGKNGSYTFFGRLNTDLGRTLCSSGELRAILDEAQVPPIAKDGLYRHTCTAEYDREMVLSIYTFLMPGEKQELMRSFARHGYEVNLVHC